MVPGNEIFENMEIFPKFNDLVNKPANESPSSSASNVPADAKIIMVSRSATTPEIEFAALSNAWVPALAAFKAACTYEHYNNKDVEIAYQ